MRVDIRHFDCFWLICYWCFDILTDVWAVMNDIDWDWVRTVMNEVNWHSAVHCKNDLIDLDWEVCDDLIEWKLLYTQHYAHKAQLWTLQIKWSRNMNVLFEKKIIVTECFINNSRFDLEFKTDMKFSASQQSSVISKAALFMK